MRSAGPAAIVERRRGGALHPDSEDGGLVRTAVKRFTVPDARGLDAAVAGHLARGFVVVGRTDRFAVLRKGKRFNPGYALLGSLFCGVGLLLYLLLYGVQSDEVVEVSMSEPGHGVADLSDDRRWWWDGERWEDTEQAVPPGRRRSPDGAYWWDGVAWRPVPAAERRWWSPLGDQPLGDLPSPLGQLSPPPGPPPRSRG